MIRQKLKRGISLALIVAGAFVAAPSAASSSPYPNPQFAQAKRAKPAEAAKPAQLAPVVSAAPPAAASLAPRAYQAGTNPPPPAGLIIPTPTQTFEDVRAADYQSKVQKSHAGRVLVVSFWASYCAPCLDEMPQLQVIGAKLQSQGVDLVFVDTDGKDQRDSAMRALQKNAITLSTLAVVDDDPQVFIDAVSPGWGGEVPYTLVYDRAGNVVQKLSGQRSAAELEAAILSVVGTR